MSSRCVVSCFFTHLVQPLSGGTVHEVSAALNDGDEGDKQDGEELHHGANLPDPGRQVQVARIGGPVEHLVEATERERDDGQDHLRRPNRTMFEFGMLFPIDWLGPVETGLYVTVRNVTVMYRTYITVTYVRNSNVRT